MGSGGSSPGTGPPAVRTCRPAGRRGVCPWEDAACPLPPPAAAAQTPCTASPWGRRPLKGRPGSGQGLRSAAWLAAQMRWSQEWALRSATVPRRPQVRVLPGRSVALQRPAWALGHRTGTCLHFHTMLAVLPPSPVQDGGGVGSEASGLPQGWGGAPKGGGRACRACARCFHARGPVGQRLPRACLCPAHPSFVWKGSAERGHLSASANTSATCAPGPTEPGQRGDRPSPRCGARCPDAARLTVC